MSDESDPEGFQLFEETSDAVTPLDLTSILMSPPQNQASRLSEALRRLDDLARQQTEPDRLAEVIGADGYPEFVAHILALDIGSPNARLRTAIARAYRLSWDFATRYANGQDRTLVANALQANVMKAVALHRASMAELLAAGVPDTHELHARFSEYVGRLQSAALSVAPMAHQPRHLAGALQLWDVLDDADVDMSTSRDVTAAMRLLRHGSDGRVEIDEQAAATYHDKAAIERLRDVLQGQDLPVDDGTVDPIDFLIIALAEFYALVLGRAVPTHIDRRAHRDNGPASEFVAFLEAVFQVCRLPMTTSWENRIRKYRNMFGTRGRFQQLAVVGRAARNRETPPFLIDAHRHLTTVKLLDPLPDLLKS